MSKKLKDSADYSTTEFSGAGNFYIRGDDADQIGPLFSQWLEEISGKLGIEVTAYHYNFYQNKR